MLRHAAASIRLQATRSPRSLLALRTANARTPVAAISHVRPTAGARRTFAASAWRRDEDTKPAPPEPLPPKFDMSEADKTRLTRLRNVGISAHIDSGTWPTRDHRGPWSSRQCQHSSS